MDWIHTRDRMPEEGVIRELVWAWSPGMEAPLLTASLRTVDAHLCWTPLVPPPPPKVGRPAYRLRRRALLGYTQTLWLGGHEHVLLGFNGYQRWMSGLPRLAYRRYRRRRLSFTEVFEKSQKAFIGGVLELR